MKRKEKQDIDPNAPVHRWEFSCYKCEKIKFLAWTATEKGPPYDIVDKQFHCNQSVWFVDGFAERR